MSLLPLRVAIRWRCALVCLSTTRSEYSYEDQSNRFSRWLRSRQFRFCPYGFLAEPAAARPGAGFLAEPAAACPGAGFLAEPAAAPVLVH
jgi:hypothetical protein